MTHRTVAALDGGREAVAVVAAILTICVAWGSVLAGRQRHEDRTRLLEYQIDGYRTLDAMEQGLHADLDVAGREIDQLYDSEKTWLSIEQLEQELIPPFAEDSSWVQRGKPSWTLTTATAAGVQQAAYLGRPSEGERQYAFLLRLQSHGPEAQAVEGREASPEEEIQIWYQPFKTARLPDSLLERELIRAGWKQVIAYRGAAEFKRLKEQ